jgi:uncharacterized membrane protein YadS
MFCKNFPELRIKEISDSVYKILIASLIMFVFTFLIRQFLGSMMSLQTFWSVFLQLAICGITAVAVYIFISYKLKSQELKTIEDSFLKKFLY